MSACQKADGNYFLGLENTADDGIPTTVTTITLLVCCRTPTGNCTRPFRKEVWNADIRCSVSAW
jgi:hypothetical protein